MFHTISIVSWFKHFHWYPHPQNMQKETQKTIKTHIPIYIKKNDSNSLGCNTNICIGFHFTGCAPLALCICTGCTQRYPSHCPPSEAHPPFLQTEDLFGHCYLFHITYAGLHFCKCLFATHQWHRVVLLYTHWEWSPSPVHEFSWSC